MSTETDNLSRIRGVGQGDGSPGRPPGRPMRQLEFNQAMSDFRHMFPETDEEVIEAVLRANNGMVDATIDQLLTMNIDSDVAGDDDDLSDHILMSVERDVQQQQSQFSHSGSRRSGRESKSTKKPPISESLEKSSKDGEDCPPSYTEAVQSHLTTHHHRSNNGRSRHRNSPTLAVNNGGGHHLRHSLGTMQHLLDLGPDTAPAGVPGTTSSTPKTHGHHHSAHHHGYHHAPRSSNHHRRRGETLDGSPHKPRPGRNLLAPMGSYSPNQDLVNDDSCFRPQRKGSLDSSDFSSDTPPGFGREKSPHRWRSSHKESTSVKRPVYRNWNPPLLGTLPDDFLRINHPPAIPQRPVKSGVQLHRAASAVGPERPRFYPTSPTILSTDSNARHSTSHMKQRPSQKPHRSLSFAGHTNQNKRPQNIHSSGLVQHEFSSDILHERMKENERRRKLTSIDVDPDLTQYLEDERLAIMLQNSEFLQELRGDRMFMMTLEKDQRMTESEKTKPEVPADPLTPPDLDNRDFIEGYGDDRSDALELPFTPTVPHHANEDVELRKKLSNMGKASRKQFAALARRFFLKRKKKSAQQILKESQAPSMMNLLDEDEDEAEDDSFDNGEHNTGSESLNSSSHNENHSVSTQSWSSVQPRQHFDVV